MFQFELTGCTNKAIAEVATNKFIQNKMLTFYENKNYMQQSQTVFDCLGQQYHEIYIQNTNQSLTDMNVETTSEK